MSGADVAALIVSILLLVYLIAAMLRPERF
jgi:K+-transporting ATPase KdpF subunit